MAGKPNKKQVAAALNDERGDPSRESSQKPTPKSTVKSGGGTSSRWPVSSVRSKPELEIIPIGPVTSEMSHMHAAVQEAQGIEWIGGLNQMASRLPTFHHHHG